MSASWKKYAPDILGAVAVYITLAFVDLLAPPFERKLFLDDESISYPYATQETVPTWLLIVLTFVLPVVVIIGSSYFFGERKFTRDVYVALLGFVIAYGLTGLFTDIVKVTAGRYRPDFLDRCQWDAAISACTGDPGVVAEGRKSFPSGHSSFSWCGLGYLSLYLAAKLNIFDKQGMVWKVLVTSIPLVGAYLIAISRVDDYRHFPGDVTAGAILGYFIAYFMYRQYYPSLINKQSSLPYAISGDVQPVREADAASVSSYDRDNPYRV